MTLGQERTATQVNWLLLVSTCKFIVSKISYLHKCITIKLVCLIGTERDMKAFEARFEEGERTDLG